MKRLKPPHWFSAHLHVRYEAEFHHDIMPSMNPDEINLDSSDDEEDNPTNTPLGPRTTKFLSLDKCLPNRQFLEVIDIETPLNAPLELKLDAEWLSIVKATHTYATFTQYPPKLPSDEEVQNLIKQERIWVDQQPKSILDPSPFYATAPSHQFCQYLENGLSTTILILVNYCNPQTESIFERLECPSFINIKGVKLNDDQLLELAKQRLLAKLD
jgi:lariat debranching enzyme